MEVFKKFLNRIGMATYGAENIERNPSIALLDTSIASLNVGDEIINDACRQIFKELFPFEQVVRVSTHDGISAVGINRVNMTSHRFVCGSNILNSKLLLTQQWNYGPLDFMRLKPLILIGVGWGNYQNTASRYTRLVYKKKLDSGLIHSVRDSYTADKLREIGIFNVVNTGCPTMWGLTPSHCRAIPTNKSDQVVFTLTDYRRDSSYDEKMIKMLLEKYHRVFFWVQGSADLSYFRTMNSELTKRVVIVPPRLDEYDALLSSEKVDFVGTRLHAGIRALQHQCRAIIVAVDNRAIEKQKDFNMPVVFRSEGVGALSNMIDSLDATTINMNLESIASWKSQFKVGQP